MNNQKLLSKKVKIINRYTKESNAIPANQPKKIVKRIIKSTREKKQKLKNNSRSEFIEDERL